MWIWYIIIGAVAGWIAGLIVKGKGQGLLLNIVIGIIGGVVGGWLFGLMGLSSSNMWGSLITAVAGAIALLLIIGLFTKKKT